MSGQLQLSLSPHDLALVDAVAARVVELLEQRAHPGQERGLVDAAELARVLGVSRSTVYDHRDELGAELLGDGSRPRLRFDVERARAAWTRRVTGRSSQQPEMPAPGGVRRRRSTGPSGSRTPLLAVKGRKVA